MDSKRKHKNLDTSLKVGVPEKQLLGEKSRKESSIKTQNKSNSKTPVAPISLRQAAGVRCGELFVTNNAHRWTFVCTFCNKSTRDIGEFICHIKSKHLSSSSNCNDRDGYNYMRDETENEQSMSFDNSYLDYGNFLDVNVHTESEDLTFNGQEKPQVKRINNSTPQTINAQSSIVKRKRTSESSTVDNAPINKMSSLDKTATSTLSYNSKDQHNKSSNGSSSDYDKDSDRNQLHEVAATEDDDELMPLNSEQYNNDDGVYDEEEDEEDNHDYDNKLLIALADSLDNMAHDGSSEKVKEKRRQIRGTAYCELCDKTFQYYSLYRNHMIKHSNETPFKCTICNKGFKSKQAIRYHINTHTKDKLFKCGVCQASYNAENQFITHVLSHENATTFPCIVCGKIMHSESERYQHLSEHTEERPYRCEFCNKLFRLRHHLSNHLKLHRQYRCDYCKDEFTSSIQLRKPYACAACQKVGTNNRQSIDDANSVHPLELYDSEQLTQPPIECVNVAEIITDSDTEEMKDNKERQVEEDGVDDDDDDDDDDNDDDKEGEEDDEDEDGEYNDDKSHEDSEADENDNNAEHDKDKTYSPTMNKKKRFICKDCGRSYANLSGLNFHIKHKHINFSD